ncbi:MAG: hypothetical protein V7L23_34525 [Nostoc sp.]|uniref:hypothetical protein n=1 Tax=Nostoc sp. TaxID=1180 RepID=UPI002FF00414
MSNQDHDCNLLNGTPDPTWDYYLIWHQLQYCKSRIEKALQTISKNEYSAIETDREMRRLLIDPCQELNNIVDAFPCCDDEIA